MFRKIRYLFNFLFELIFELSVWNACRILAHQDPPTTMVPANSHPGRQVHEAGLTQRLRLIQRPVGGDPQRIQLVPQGMPTPLRPLLSPSLWYDAKETNFSALLL